VVLWHHSGGVYALWARRERREKSAERVARGRNFMISLGIPSGPGALPVPSELSVSSNASRVVMSASVRVESPRGSMKNWSGVSGCSQGGIGSSGGVARVSSVSKCEWTAART
jgi:hypothetical protein